MALTVAFYILAVVIVVAAIGVITQKNVFRAALALIVSLVGVAGIFITLSADFLAAAQILIYVGAISVVIILAIMLTREFSHGSPSNRLKIPAFIVAAAFFGLTVFAVVKTHWQIVSTAPQTPTTAGLAGQLFTQNGYLLPLEITAILILAVVVGAIAIAREK